MRRAMAVSGANGTRRTGGARRPALAVLVVMAACLVFGAACAGCTDAPQSADDARPAGNVQPADDGFAAFCEGHLFADALPDEALEKPARIISSYEDFVYALDYLAFFRVADEVWFELDADYRAGLFNPYPEFRRAYEAADLADVYACQLDDGYFTQYGVIGVKYSMSQDIATVPASPTDTPVVPSFDRAASARVPASAGEIDAFAASLPIANAGLERIPCETGEQLYWLAMNGYEPAPVAGSRAEELYGQATAVLAALITPDMSDFAKIKAVYDWLTTEVVYDRDTAYSTETYLVTEQAYYLEGVLLNHCAVCDGKAKAMALMLNMLGVPCVRETGAGGAGDHAWNMVQLEGKWYLVCSTYGQKDMAKTIGRIVPNYSVFLTAADTGYGADWDFVPQKHADIVARVEEEPYDAFAAMSELAGVDLRIGGIEELAALIAQVDARPASAGEYKVEFLYTGEDADGFEHALVDWIDGQENVFATSVPCKGGQVYQLIRLTA